MNPHCKGCLHHHNAGLPPTALISRLYNDWCAKQGKSAQRAVGRCKNENLKEATPAAAPGYRSGAVLPSERSGQIRSTPR